jgi:hypothetical protein
MAEGEARKALRLPDGLLQERHLIFLKRRWRRERDSNVYNPFPFCKLLTPHYHDCRLCRDSRTALPTIAHGAVSLDHGAYLASRMGIGGLIRRGSEKRCSTTMAT